MDRHHLLEIILWPNGDGTYKTILNSAKRLKELGIYDDFKLTIPLDHGTHSRLHSLHLSDETREKMSAAMTGPNNHRYGVAVSQETRNKKSKALKGHAVSEITRRKISKILTGRKLSDETKAKCSASHKGKTLSEEHRRKISESMKLARAKNKKVPGPKSQEPC